MRIWKDAHKDAVASEAQSLLHTAPLLGDSRNAHTDTRSVGKHLQEDRGGCTFAEEVCALERGCRCAHNHSGVHNEGVVKVDAKREELLSAQGAEVYLAKCKEKGQAGGYGRCFWCAGQLAGGAEICYLACLGHFLPRKGWASHGDDQWC
eukprot:1136474-Pelagomonas_calceolata.AAC.6